MRVSGPQPRRWSVAAKVRAANLLIENIQESTVLSRRDRAIIGVIGYAWVPVHGIITMKVRDYYQSDGNRCVRWIDHDGTERHEFVVPRLERLLDEYVAAAGIEDDSWGPLFRPSNGHNLVSRSMRVVHIAKMIRDRHEEAERLSRLSKRLMKSDPRGITPSGICAGRTTIVTSARAMDAWFRSPPPWRSSASRWPAWVS